MCGCVVECVEGDVVWEIIDWIVDKYIGVLYLFWEDWVVYLVELERVWVQVFA